MTERLGQKAKLQPRLRADGKLEWLRRDGTVATSHPKGCECPRCVEFQPGNQHAAKHGAYSAVPSTVVDEVVEEIAKDMREAGTFSPAFRLAIEGAAQVVAECRRAEAAYAWVRDLVAGRSNEHRAYVIAGDAAKGLLTLREYVRRLQESRKRHLASLGLDPVSAGSLFKDVGIAHAAARRSLPPSTEPSSIDLDALSPPELVELFAALDRAAEAAA